MENSLIQNLEQIVTEIVPTVPPPYDSPEKLSQVVLKIGQMQEVGRLSHGLVPDIFLYLYLHCQEEFPIGRFGYDEWRCLKRVIFYKEDSSEFGHMIEIYNNAVKAKHHFENPSLSRDEVEELSQTKTDNFLTFVKQLKQPTVGLLNAATSLEYLDLGDGIKLLKSVEPTRFIHLAGYGFMLETSPQSEDGNTSITKIISHQKEALSNLLQRIDLPTILDFPSYNFCDSNTFPKTFIKWVNPARVTYLDDEISFSAELHQQGFSATKFIGYGHYGDNAFLIGEKIEGVDFSKVGYDDDLTVLLGDNAQNYLSFLKDSFPNTKITQKLWRQQTAKAYQALGREIRKLTKAKLYCPDLAALRNSMLTYVNQEPVVTFVDYERAESRPMAEFEREEFLHQLNTELMNKSFEKKHFYLGFKERDN